MINNTSLHFEANLDIIRSIMRSNGYKFIKGIPVSLIHIFNLIGKQNRFARKLGLSFVPANLISAS